MLCVTMGLRHKTQDFPVVMAQAPHPEIYSQRQPVGLLCGRRESLKTEGEMGGHLVMVGLFFVLFYYLFVCVCGCESFFFI